MNRFLLAVAVLLSVVLPGCPQPTGCNSSTCQGCCDQRGVCQLGVSSSSCGARGMLCTECGAGLACSNGACLFGSSGTGGGVAATGGGASGTGGGLATAGGVATGGGAGRLDQELVSGTRLRAINFVGADGSRAPGLFWDTQLNTVCTAMTYPGSTGLGARCFPSVVFPILSPNYGDPGCTQPIFGNILPTPLVLPYVEAGFPSPAVYGLSVTFADGGQINTFHTLVPAQARYLLSGTSCTSGGSPGANMFVSSGTVAPTTFLAMPMVRE